jgi:hypothetical protein
MGMNDIAVVERVMAARDRGAVVTPFESDLAATDIEALCSFSRHASRVPLHRMDVSEIVRSRVVSWFRGLGIGDDVLVAVVWPALRAGAWLRFGAFVDSFDDLWHPSSDDVLVTDEERTWMITLDHEEIFTFGVLD